MKTLVLQCYLGSIEGVFTSTLDTYLNLKKYIDVEYKIITTPLYKVSDLFIQINTGEEEQK